MTNKRKRNAYNLEECMVKNGSCSGNRDSM